MFINVFKSLLKKSFKVTTYYTLLLSFVVGGWDIVRVFYMPVLYLVVDIANLTLFLKNYQ